MTIEDRDGRMLELYRQLEAIEDRMSGRAAALHAAQGAVQKDLLALDVEVARAGDVLRGTPAHCSGLGGGGHVMWAWA